MERGYFEGRKRSICGTEKQRLQAGERGFVRRREASRASGFLALGQGAGRFETQGIDGKKRSELADRNAKKFTEMATISF